MRILNFYRAITQKRRKHHIVRIRKISIALLSVFVFLLVFFHFFPYLLPVSSPESDYVDLPFEESRRETIDDVSLHYRLWIPQGDIEGKILMVHGLGGSTFSWIQSALYISEQGYLVAAVDLPGFGYSDRTPGMDHGQKNRSSLLWGLAEIIDEKTNLHNLKWVLTGHSMGGGTVAAMAFSKPEKIHSLVFVAGALFDNNPGRSSAFLKYPPIQRWVKAFLHLYAIHPKRIESILDSAYQRPPYDFEIQGYLEPLKQPGTPNTMIDLVKTAKNEPVKNLANLDMPMLGIWGENDTWVTVEQGYRLLEIVPGMELRIIESAGHCPMETHPEEFNEIIKDFLS